MYIAKVLQGTQGTLGQSKGALIKELETIRSSAEVRLGVFDELGMALK
jgi:hypothetical protein